MENQRPSGVKIAIITRGYMDYVIGLANSLSKSCHVYVYLSKADEDSRFAFDPAVRIKPLRAGRVSNVTANCLYMYSLYRDLINEAIDIIHYQSGVVWELALMHLFGSRKKHIITVHDVERHPDQRGWRGLPPWVLAHGPKKSDGIIVHGRILKAQAHDVFRVPLNKIKVLPHGTINRYGACQGRPRVDKKNVLFFGNIDIYKGIPDLVAAVKIINKMDARVNFTIAGNCNRRRAYSDLLTGTANIDFRPWRQEEKDVQKLFSTADVIVLPYIEASQSGVLMLAYAYSIPAVVTDVGALGEVIKNNKNGLVVPPGDPAAIARAIMHLVTDMDLRKKIIANINREKSSIYNWDNIAAQTLEYYHQLLGGRY